MRRMIAWVTLGLLVLFSAAFVAYGDEDPRGDDPIQGQHQFGEEGQYGREGQHGFQGRGFGGEYGHGRMGWQRGGHREFGGRMSLLRMAENPHVRQTLGLTDEQVSRLHRIAVDSEKASIQTRADLELRHLELRELMRAENPDQAAIMQKLDEVNALRGKMAKARVKTMLDARSVLTPEQIKKVRALMESRAGERRPEREHRMEHRGGPGHPPSHPEGGAGTPSTPPAGPPVQ